REVTQAFFDGAVIINVTFTPGLAVGVSASIHRIGQDVVDRRVSRGDPTDLARGPLLQRERQLFGAKPEPDAASRTEFGKTLKDRMERPGDGLVGMKADLAIAFSPHEAHGQPAAQ